MSDHSTLSYSDRFSIEMDKLPRQSLHRLASYGLAHYLGNQASAKVTTFKDKDENKDATDEQVAAFKASVQDKMFAAVLDGTMGVHATRTPSQDPEEAEMDRLAKVEVVATLKANNIKVPKKDEAVEFASGEKLSMDDLVDRRIAKHGERLRTEAKASLKAKAKAKDAIAKKVAGAGASELL